MRSLENKYDGIFSLLRKFVQGQMRYLVPSSYSAQKHVFAFKIYCTNRLLMQRNRYQPPKRHIRTIFILVPRTQFNVTVLLACIRLMWFSTQYKGEIAILVLVFRGFPRINTNSFCATLWFEVAYINDVVF